MSDTPAAKYIESAPTQTVTVQVQDATARLEALKAQGDATEAHSRLDAVVGRVDAISARVDGLVPTIGGRLDALEERLNRVFKVDEDRGWGSLLAQLSGRLAKLEKWLDTVYSPQRDGWLTEIGRLAKRLDTMERSNHAAEDGRRQAEKALEEARERNRRWIDRCEGLAARIEALEAHAAETADRLGCAPPGTQLTAADLRAASRPDLYAPPAGLKVDPNATRPTWAEPLRGQGWAIDPSVFVPDLAKKDAEIARLKACLATSEEEIKAYNQRWQKALADHAKAAQEREEALKQANGMAARVEVLTHDRDAWKARYWREVEKRLAALAELDAHWPDREARVRAALNAPDGTAQAAPPEPSAEVVALKEKVEGLERAASSARRLWEEQRDTLRRRIDAAIVVTEGRDMFRPIVAILSGKVDVP